MTDALKWFDDTCYDTEIGLTWNICKDSFNSSKILSSLSNENGISKSEIKPYVDTSFLATPLKSSIKCISSKFVPIESQYNLEILMHNGIIKHANINGVTFHSNHEINTLPNKMSGFTSLILGSDFKIKASNIDLSFSYDGHGTYHRRKEFNYKSFLEETSLIKDRQVSNIYYKNKNVIHIKSPIGFTYKEAKAECASMFGHIFAPQKYHEMKHILNLQRQSEFCFKTNLKLYFPNQNIISASNEVIKENCDFFCSSKK